jgi:hypothetical protein
MKWFPFIYSLVFCCLIVPIVHATDPDPVGADIWTQEVTNGFGNPTQNQEVSWLQNFNGYLYAAVNTSGIGAQVFRTADLTHWTAVGPALGSTANKINRMTVNGSSDLYMSVNAGGPPALYHSTNGRNWTQINTASNGYTNSSVGSLSGLAVGGSNLFASLRSQASAAQIWRANLDGTGFAKVADFNTGLNINTGANTNLNEITYLYAASNGTIYAPIGNRGPTGNGDPQDGFLFLYESTDGGAHWTQNTGVGNGFGNPHNPNIASMTEFNGYLYASVHNPTTGGELWRTPFNAGNSFNDTVWQQVLSGGIDDSLNYELHHLSADHGYLWLTTMGVPPSGSVSASPDEVWRSSDGVNWVQSNTAGFGDPVNGVSRYPAITGFGAQEVFGGRNLANGAQIFATIAPVPTPAIFLTPGGVLTVSWSATATNVVLETTSSLAPPVIWGAVTNAVQTVNGLFSVQVNTAPRLQFFRLKR